MADFDKRTLADWEALVEKETKGLFADNLPIIRGLMHRLHPATFN